MRRFPCTVWVGTVATHGGLPAFTLRDAVDATQAHRDYSSTKAQCELGWTHPDIHTMWDQIMRRERELAAAHQGFLNKLRSACVCCTLRPVIGAAVLWPPG